MKTISRALRDFVDRLAPMLPADFAVPVRAIDLGRPEATPSQLPVCRY